MKRHASKRLEERYNAENSDNLLRRLEREIISGNFIALSSHGSVTKGYVSLDGEAFEVVFDSKNSRIITALPKGSLTEEKTRKYHGRQHVQRNPNA